MFSFSKPFVFLVFILLAILSRSGFSQASNDTVVTVKEGKDTVVVKRKGMSKPTIATLLSVAIPGAGQVYNGVNWYWKVPLIYGIMGGLIAWAVDNGWKYNIWATRYNEAYNTPTGENYNSFAEGYSTLTKSELTNQIRVVRDGYRRDRDFAIILTSVAYVLNIADACVDAHLKEFDVNEKIALKVRPTLLPDGYSSITTGIALQMRFKTVSESRRPLTFY